MRLLGEGRTYRAAPLGLLAMAFLVVASPLTGCSPARTAVDTTVHSFTGNDYTRFVDNNQGAGQVFMRVPLGRIGLWSTPEGELADSVTRGLMLYPTVDHVVDKGAADWRASINASPSQTDITYDAALPTRGSTVALTATPDVSVYRYHFGNGTSYGAVDSDLRDTETILEAAADTLDLTRPVAVMLIAVLHLISDSDEPASIIARLMDVVPPGSTLAISHVPNDMHMGAMSDMSDRLSRLLSQPSTYRSRAQVTAFFDALDLVDPGVVPIQQWRPDTKEEAEAVAAMWGGVAVKR